MGGTVHSPLVGRMEEMALVRAAFDAAVDHRPGLVLVSGEAGVGKTRLLTEFAPEVHACGGRLLVGACLDIGEEGLPYAPVVGALRDLFRGLDPGALAELLGPAPEELVRLFPHLAPYLKRRASPTAAPGEDGSAQGRLFETILGLLATLAETAPVLLAIEDLHWADRTSLELLTFLVHNLHSERLLLLATYRSDCIHRRHRLRPVLSELNRSRLTSSIYLCRLDRDETATLLTGLLPEAPTSELVDTIFSLAEGNVFYTEELAAAGTSTPGAALPSSLKDVLLGRVCLLSDEAQETVRIAATVGREVGHRLLAAVSSLPTRSLHAALREAVDQQVLQSGVKESCYRFRHALMQEAVYGDLLPGERVALHADIAGTLSEDPTLATGDSMAAAEISYHWYAAHDLPRALRAAVDAARVAGSIYAFAEAQRQWERALQVWHQVPSPEEQAGIGREELLLLAADAARWASGSGRAIALVREALVYASDTETVGTLHERLGRYLWEAGDTAGSWAAYEEASRVLTGLPPSALQARVLAAQGAALMIGGRYTASRQRCEKAIDLARAVGAQREEGHAANTLGVDLGMTGDPVAGVRALEEALSLAMAVGNLEDVTRAYSNLSFLLTNLGRLEEALAVARRGMEMTREYGLELTAGAGIVCNAAATLSTLGRWEEAVDLVQSALERNLSDSFASFAYETLATVAIARGRFLDAREHIARAQELSQQLDEPQLTGPLAVCRADLALWTGDDTQARQAVTECLGLLGDGENGQLIARLCSIGLRAAADQSERVRVLPVASDVDDVAAWAEALLRRVRSVGCSPPGRGSCAPEVRINVLLCEAEMTRLVKLLAPGKWAALAAEWEVQKQPYPQAYALFRQAEVLVLLHQSDDARAPLRRARHMATSLGAVPLLREIDFLARQARLDEDTLANETPVEAPSAADRLGLTRREREVLAHLVTGSTNRQIARALFISERTAGVHVSNILTKLSVANRGQAAAAAHRLRLVPDDQEFLPRPSRPIVR